MTTSGRVAKLLLLRAPLPSSPLLQAAVPCSRDIQSSLSSWQGKARMGPQQQQASPAGRRGGTSSSLGATRGRGGVPQPAGGSIRAAPQARGARVASTSPRPAGSSPSGGGSVGFAEPTASRPGDPDDGRGSAVTGRGVDGDVPAATREKRSLTFSTVERVEWVPPDVEAPSPEDPRSVAAKSGSFGRPRRSDLSESADSISTIATSDSDCRIKVGVRIRPLRSSEKDQGETAVVSSFPGRPNIVQIVWPSPEAGSGTNEERVPLALKFDWVMPQSASQEMVYRDLGEPVMQSVADGFHGCVFAYGQTGSGKSHTIFGGVDREDRGLLSRITEGLFAELEASKADYMVKVSYLEIYNERLRDLLRPGDSPASDLQVRQHPKVGVFVEGLTSNAVRSADDVERLLDFGHKIRVVGRTNMHAASSRSHAVVTLHVEKSVVRGGGPVSANSGAGWKWQHKDPEEGEPSIDEGPRSQLRRDSGQEQQVGDVAAGGQGNTYVLRRRAQLHTVDLAGSERMRHAGDLDVRQQESKQINKSLLALSMMIQRLSAMEQATSAQASSLHIPYRNSKLTYILSDSLMGNCRTVMIACVSPAQSSVSMSESTIRFAASAKKIRTRPVKNEELDGDLVTSLRAEIEQLRQQLSDVGSSDRRSIEERIATTSLVLRDESASWAEQQAEAAAYEQERQRVLQSLGVSSRSLAAAWREGTSVSKLVNADTEPYLVNVCEDPLLSGRVIYSLPRGEMVRVGSDASCEIQLDGLGVQPVMCYLLCEDGKNVKVHVDLFGGSGVQGGADDRKASDRRRPHLDVGTEETRVASATRRFTACSRRGTLFKGGVAQVFINSQLVQKSSPIRHGERLRIGRTHVFQLFIPRTQSKLDRRESIAVLIEQTEKGIGEQILAKEYAQHLKERIGPEKAKRVFLRFKELQSAVEEANEISEELRGDEAHELVFKAHVLTDVTHANLEPELAVILRQIEKPDDINHLGAPAFHHGAGPELKTTVWSVEKFQQRLEVMRDLYHDVSEREATWGELGDPDPWEDDSGVPVVGGTASGKMVAFGSSAVGESAKSLFGEKPHRAGTSGSLYETKTAGLSNGATATAVGPAPEPDAEPQNGVVGCDAKRVAMLEAELQQMNLRLAAREAELSSREVELRSLQLAQEELLTRLPTKERSRPLAATPLVQQQASRKAASPPRWPLGAGGTSLGAPPPQQMRARPRSPLSHRVAATSAPPPLLSRSGDGRSGSAGGRASLPSASSTGSRQHVLTPQRVRFVPRLAGPPRDSSPSRTQPLISPRGGRSSALSAAVPVTIPDARRSSPPVVSTSTSAETGAPPAPAPVPAQGPAVVTTGQIASTAGVGKVPSEATSSDIITWRRQVQEQLQGELGSIRRELDALNELCEQALIPS